MDCEYNNMSHIQVSMESKAQGSGSTTS